MITYSNNTLLYAWASPAWSEVTHLDHTFVNDFNFSQEKYRHVCDAYGNNRNYWYCWGGFYQGAGTPNNPSGLIGSQTGDLKFSRYLVESNASAQDSVATRGTITLYGLYGVCHQLANQILFSTQLFNKDNEPVGTPLTVKGVRGYNLSSFVYGTYGLRHNAWREKIDNYTDAKPIKPFKKALMDRAATDEFVEYLKQSLVSEAKLVNKIVEFRKEFINDSRTIEELAQGKLTGEVLNKRNQSIFDEVAKLMPKDKFKEVFGIEPNTKITLVDSNLVD